MLRRDPNTEDENQFVDYDENEHTQFLTQDCNSASYRLGNKEENVSEAEHNSNISEPLENKIVDYNELVD